jgi:hypothetical protein
VSDGYLDSLVILLTVLWIASAASVLLSALRAGAVLNILVAVVVGGSTLPKLIGLLLGYQAYVLRYGSAAVHELPLTLAALALSLLAICLSTAALRWGGALFFLSWLANAPMIALSIYLAFWFHIF